MVNKKGQINMCKKLQESDFSYLIHPMTRLIRLESVNNDTEIGAFAIEFPSGCCKSVSWKSQAPITDSLAAAKEYASKCLQTCLDEGRQDDAERTNWASVTAAIQRIVMDWNEVRRNALYAARH